MATSPLNLRLNIDFSPLMARLAAANTALASFNGLFIPTTVRRARQMRGLHIPGVQFALQGKQLQRHRRRCRTCNPLGNPRPSALNRHGYNRRRNR